MLNDQPGRAVEVLERARDAAPEAEETYGRLTAAYHMNGQPEAALEAAAAVEKYGPNLGVELYRVKLAHFRDPADLEKILDAVSGGGLQRWPFRFSALDRRPLTGPEIEEIAVGRTWKGTSEGFGPALMQIDENGNLGFQTTNYIATRVAHVEDDMLCEHTEGLTLGRTICGPVYYTDLANGDEHAYVYVNATKVFWFSSFP